MGQIRNKRNKKYFETSEIGDDLPKIRGSSKSSFKRDIHSDKCLPQEQEKSQTTLLYPSKNYKKKNK